MSDWRLNGQEDYLSNKTLYKITFPEFWKIAYKDKNAFFRKSNAMQQSMSRKQTAGMNTWKVKKSNTFGMTIAHFAGKKH